MTLAQKDLLGLLSSALFGKPVPAIEADWRDIFAEAQAQAVAILAFEPLVQIHSEPDVMQEWGMYSAQAAVRNINVFYYHSRMHRLMSENGIPYVILKGGASAEYYPVPAYRMCGDVDFLVPKEQLDAAAAIMEAQGFARTKASHDAHIHFMDSGISMELHFSLGGLPEGREGVIAWDYLKDIYDHARLIAINEQEMRVPSAFHHGLVMLLHICQHLTSEGIGLRHLCDWAVFADSFTDEEFCALFEEKLKEIGLWKLAQVLTTISSTWLGAAEKNWAKTERALADALLEDILKSGNFGKKDRMRVKELMLLSTNGKHSAKKVGMAQQYILSVNRIVSNHWPVCKVCPVFYPFGWLYYGGRRALRILLGRRELPNLAVLLSGAKERRTVYNELNLFQAEGDPEA